MIHTYNDLLDFVLDFQKTRSGAPTKNMQKELRNWDRSFNQQNATEAQRLAWRRSYTINWLYDLVNVFSAIAVQRNTMKGQRWVYEAIDWSPSGPWDKHRRLFGLNAFAGVITSLAMQRPNTNVRNQINPHHVFQLQSIVDSFTVSRGWPISPLRGYVLDKPPPGFRPRRDVDLFLDRENKKVGTGYLQAVSVLRQLFDRDAQLHGDSSRHKLVDDIIEGFQFDFINWLGESKYMHGLNTIPPSRFTSSNANGLWEYSPYLCGTGLMEGLELAYASSMKLWDSIPEPFLCIHMHNMLVQKGYIASPVGLYVSLQEIFPSDSFAGGKVPTSNFHRALKSHLDETSTRKARRQVSHASNEARNSQGVHDTLRLDANRFFKTKPNVLLYRQALWIPDRIPESDIHPATTLAMTRIACTKRFKNPGTGKVRFEETDLIKRAKALGMDEETLLRIAATPSMMHSTSSQEVDLSTLRDQLILPADYSINHSSKPEKMRTEKHKDSPAVDMSNTETLDLLKADIFADVCGHNPLSGLNYLFATVRFFTIMMMVEKQLQTLRNPIWVKAYETRQEWAKQKRVGLVYMAMESEDEECLRTMAEAFQNPRAGFLEHFYWGDIDPGQQMIRKKTKQRQKSQQHDLPDPECSVM